MKKKAKKKKVKRKLMTMWSVVGRDNSVGYSTTKQASADSVAWEWNDYRISGYPYRVVRFVESP
jgi:hypothetical protein